MSVTETAVKVTAIEWDTDGEDVDLPTEVIIEDLDMDSDDDDEAIADEICERLTEGYGWCVEEFQWEYHDDTAKS